MVAGECNVMYRLPASQRERTGCRRTTANRRVIVQPERLSVFILLRHEFVFVFFSAFVSIPESVIILNRVSVIFFPAFVSDAKFKIASVMTYFFEFK